METGLDAYFVVSMIFAGLGVVLMPSAICFVAFLLGMISMMLGWRDKNG